jgi:hypothetical protein
MDSKRTDIHEKIAAATDQERGDLIRRVKAFDWTEKRKDTVIKFIMFLGLVGGNSKKQ